MPFIFCLYFFKKHNAKDIKVFFVYTLLLFISIIAVLTFRYIFNSYSTYLIFYRFFIVIEFALISYFFYLNIIEKIIKRIILFFVFCFCIFSIYDYLATLNTGFSYHPLVLECLLFPSIIILFFYEKLKYNTKFPIYLYPGFWIAVGFLIFSTGNFFLFLFSKLLLQNLENKHLYNSIYGSFTILKNVFLCAAIGIAANSKLNDDPSAIDINLDLETFTPSINNTNFSSKQ